MLNFIEKRINVFLSCSLVGGLAWFTYVTGSLLGGVVAVAAFCLIGFLLSRA